MEKSTLRKADLVFSIVLMFLSVWILIQSAKLFFNPFGRSMEDINPDELKTLLIQWYQSPALLPAILAMLLLLCAVILMHYALRQGAKLDFFTKENLKKLLHKREFYVVLIVVFTLYLYIFAAIPVCRRFLNFFPRFQGFPFMIATFLYLLSMMVIFNKKKMRQLLISLAISAGAAGAITYGFGVIAMIPLP